MADGARIRVRLTPRASREEILGLREGQEDALVVKVTAPPTEDRANQALCKLLARRIGIAKGRVSIAGGGKSRDKLVAVKGVGAAQLRAKLGLPDA